MAIHISIKSQGNIAAEISGQSSFSTALPNYRVAGNAEEYTGPLEVTPDFAEQTLNTDGKKLTGNVTVHQISVSETANPSGGNTLMI